MKVLLFINRILKVFHLELNRLTKKNKIDPIHENLDFVKLLNLTRQKTLISEDRLFILYQCLISTTRLPGELAELGVYRGGSAILLSHIAKEFSPQKTLYLLDTFEGMPDTDANYDLHKKGDFNDTSIEAVKEYLKDCKNLIFLKGLFSDTLQQIENKTFCFVHIDADIYSSVLECCEFFYTRLVNGGLMVFDDYGFLSCPGAKKAVDQFFQDKTETPIYLETGQTIVQRIVN